MLILSDAQNVIRAIYGSTLEYKINYIICNIKELLYNMNKSKAVEIKWVPSHSGIQGNELADKAANSHWNEDHSDILKIPYTDFYVLLKEKEKLRWEGHWKEKIKTTGKWYASIQQNLPARPWYNNIKEYTDRKYVTILNRLRFGHCQTPAHLFRMKIITEDKCNYCNQQAADLDHLFLNCTKFHIQRLLLISELSEVSSVIPTSVIEMLKNIRNYRAIYKFVCRTTEKL